MQRCLVATISLSILLAASGCTSVVKPVGDRGVAHHSRNSLDWVGVYRGVLPCADCEGIETVVTLKGDNTYQSRARYLGKEGRTFTRQGAFQWEAGGSEIRFLGDEPGRYRLAEGRLVRLALDGSAITGPLADHYILAKVADAITEKTWKLVELRGQPVAKLQQEPHLRLATEGRRVSGFSGCNNFTGSYELDEAASRVRFGQMAGTRKFCSEGMDLETSFMAVLEQADSYSLNGDTLTLNRARMAPLARFEASDTP